MTIKDKIFLIISVVFALGFKFLNNSLISYLTTIQFYILSTIVFVIIGVVLYRNKVMKIISFKNENISTLNLFITLIGIFGTCVFLYFLQLSIFYGTEVMKYTVSVTNEKDLFLILFSGHFIVVAICEEILFRGIIYNLLSKKFGLSLTFVIASSIFFLAHYEFAFTVIVSSIGITLLYMITKSIYAVMVFHYFWNVFVTYIIDIYRYNYDKSLFLISFIITALFLIYYSNNSKKVFRFAIKGY